MLRNRTRVTPLTAVIHPTKRFKRKRRRWTGTFRRTLGMYWLQKQCFEVTMFRTKCALSSPCCEEKLAGGQNNRKPTAQFFTKQKWV